jgi:putative peptide zinc metalloprotease protein
MPIDRPTFSESWYRVAELRPKLRSTVQVYRQHYRGQMWHVLQDPSSNQYFRLNEAAYRFVGLLDGRRPVADVWKACSEQLGDGAPTQGEAIQLLGQLYTSNLLHAELAPDAEGLFRRYQKRVNREVQGFLTNLLFIRLPLLDPDRFLNAWVKILGLVFTPVGFVLWLALIAAGVYFILGRGGELAARADSILDVNNLPYLYLSFTIIKVIHEFGHAFACKRFGTITGTGGEVHVMGVMFLVFTPMPYVDASSAWAFRSRLHRIMVGAAGMYVELAVAAVATIVWAHINPGLGRTIAYNMMFVASVSTLLFNGNPLLRYDAYYILSDLIEIPNLAQRSKQYIYYLVKKYAWQVRGVRNPAHSRGEKIWFVCYGVASTAYRVFICVGILLFVCDKLFLLGAAMAIAAVVAWVFVPIGKFLHYLFVGNELMRVRGRAMISSAAVVAAIIGTLGFLPWPDRFRLEGVVDAADVQVVYTEAPGFITAVLPSGRQVEPNGAPLLEAGSMDLLTQRDQLQADIVRLSAQRRLSQAKGEVGEAQIVLSQLRAMGDQLRRVEEEIASLRVRANVRGQWVCPDADKLPGAFLDRGKTVGIVIGGQRFIRATAGQEVAQMLMEQVNGHGSESAGVEVRIKGLPDHDRQMAARITQIVEAGTKNLPSPALSVMAGGSVPTDMKDQKGTKAAERIFNVLALPAPVTDVGSVWLGHVPLLHGQRVVMRVTMPPRPLAQQWYRSLLQLVQRRFHI